MDRFVDNGGRFLLFYALLMDRNEKLVLFSR